MSTQEPNFYTVRPDGTALWLPAAIMDELGVAQGAHLTLSKFKSPTVQNLLNKRIAAETPSTTRPRKQS